MASRRAQLLHLRRVAEAALAAELDGVHRWSLGMLDLVEGH
jgi:hypothetical protein